MISMKETEGTISVYCSRCAGKGRRGGIAKFSASGSGKTQWFSKHKNH